MNIGRQRTFAHCDASGEIGNEGITYREWLIGMALTGYTSEYHVPWVAAQKAIEAADAAIELLNGEEIKHRKAFGQFLDEK
ncbi:MAG: hypothetical protein AB4290_20575 [Spirulina sp.]